MNATTPLRLIALSGLSLSTLTMLGGCSESEGEDTVASQMDDHTDHDHADDDQTGDQADAAPAPDVYAGILGELKAVPMAGVSNPELTIHHMQVPGFKTKDGTINVTADGISGMRSMTMPFPVADGVTLDGLAAGDKIRFTFVVDWSGQSENTWEVTKIEKIAPDTVIDFTNKIKEAAQEVIDDAMDNTMDAMPGHEGP